MKRNVLLLLIASLIVPLGTALSAQEPPVRLRSDPPVIRSSWDDLLEGVRTREDWAKHRAVLQRRYLDLIRDQHKPKKPALDLKVHETVVVEGRYQRLYISYQVESDERAHAYLGIPLELKGKAPAIVALHGTTAEGTKQTAGLGGNPDKAFLDHLCRRGYVVIAPEHFVSGERIPPKGAYDTTRFYEKHPEWTAVGKFNYEHSIAVDVLLTRAEVDADRIGTMGHSLGGHGAFYLAAYDERIKASVCNCGGSFLRHNPQVEAWARNRWYVYLKPIRAGLLRGELPPIDVHEIISLIAPRAYMDVSALNDGNPLTQRQRALMLLKIADVYELLGKPENFSFFIHGRKHSVPHESRELIYGFLDAHLKPEADTKTRLIEK
ncbi:MAG: alpha/beta fold hydrolase [Verrucomicrobiia bacterium]